MSAVKINDDIKNLYKELANEIGVNKYNLSIELARAIKDLPEEHTEIIFSIIILYYINNTYNNRKLPSVETLLSELIYSASKKNKTLHLPFKGKTSDNGRGCYFCIDKLNNKLQQMIAAYLLRIKI